MSGVISTPLYYISTSLVWKYRFPLFFVIILLVIVLSRCHPKKQKRVPNLSFFFFFSRSMDNGDSNQGSSWNLAVWERWVAVSFKLICLKLSWTSKQLCTSWKILTWLRICLKPSDHRWLITQFCQCDCVSGVFF